MKSFIIFGLIFLINSCSASDATAERLVACLDPAKAAAVQIIDDNIEKCFKPVPAQGGYPLDFECLKRLKDDVTVEIARGIACIMSQGLVGINDKLILEINDKCHELLGEHVIPIFTNCQESLVPGQSLLECVRDKVDDVPDIIVGFIIEEAIKSGVRLA